MFTNKKSLRIKCYINGANFTTFRSKIKKIYNPVNPVINGILGYLSIYMRPIYTNISI